MTLREAQCPITQRHQQVEPQTVMLLFEKGEQLRLVVGRVEAHGVEDLGLERDESRCGDFAQGRAQRLDLRDAPRDIDVGAVEDEHAPRGLALLCGLGANRARPQNERQPPKS